MDEDVGQLRVSSCVSKVMSVPKYKGGFGIPSFKESYEKLGLSKRLSLKSSEDGDINQIWKDTRSNFVEHETDRAISFEKQCKTSAL